MQARRQALALGLGFIGFLLTLGAWGWTGWAQDSPPGPTGVTACVPGSVYVNEPSTCTYTESDPDSAIGDDTPSGYPGPSFTVSFSSSASGSFSPTNSCVASTSQIDNNGNSIPDSWIGSCSVDYIPLAVGTGTHVITATGANDSNFDSISVLARDVSVSISCSPNPALVGSPVTCTITVTDITLQGTPLAPDGSIGLSSDLQGPLGSCTLSPISASASQCDVIFTPNTKGTHTLTATYTEDLTDGRQHADGSGSGSLQVNGFPTTTTLSCPDDGANDYFDGATFYIRAGVPETCTATVTASSGPGLTGTVSFSTTGSGSFSPNPCTLPGGSLNESCSTAYTEGLEGAFTLTASYSGDGFYDPSSGTFQLKVDGTPPTVSVGLSGASYGPCPGSSPGQCFILDTTQITVTADDPVSGGVSSGLASCSISISPSGPAASCGTPFDFSGFPDNSYAIQVTATDNVGNTTTVTYYVDVDTTPPTIDGPYHDNATCWLYPSGPACAPGSLVQPNTYVKAQDQASPPVSRSLFHYNVSDAGSGLAGCSLTGQTVPTGPYTSGAQFSMQPGDGPKSISLQCQDNLGNTSGDSVTVIVDDTPPQFTKGVGSPRWPTGCQGDPIPNCYVGASTPLTVTVTDPPAGSMPGSGVSSCTLGATGLYYGAGVTPGCSAGSNTFTLGAFTATDDRYPFTVTAQDNLGNASSASDFPNVILDTESPTIGDPVHTNTTCYPFDRCDVVPEVVVDNTWVKAQDKLPFTPSNPLLPAYPQFIPKSTFEYPSVADPDIAPGLPGSGVYGCTLSGGTTQDGFHPGTSIAGVDFSFLPGDGSRAFTLTCRDNLSNTSSKGRTLNVDDTPPVATFVTAGPRYDDPVDGTIFIESNTLITPVLTDAGVGIDLDGVGGPPADIGPTNPPCKQNQDQNGALIQRCTTPFRFPPPDRDHHLWIVRPDLLGNVAESHFVFIVDDTPPKVELITPQDQAQYVLNSEVRADWIVTDDVSFFEGGVEPPFAPELTPRGSGIRQVIATTPDGEPIDTASVGAKPFVLIAIDNLGHQTVVQVTYQVVYAFRLDSALEAALAEGAYRAGETVPLSFWLGDARGATTTDAQPRLRLFAASGEEVPLSPDGAPVLARYSPELERYTFELDTAALELEPGEYELWVQPGDATTRRIRLVLR